MPSIVIELGQDIVSVVERIMEMNSKIPKGLYDSDSDARICYVDSNVVMMVVWRRFGGNERRCTLTFTHSRSDPQKASGDNIKSRPPIDTSPSIRTLVLENRKKDLCRKQRHIQNTGCILLRMTNAI